jgi:hypothetical protein
MNVKLFLKKIYFSKAVKYLESEIYVVLKK